MEHLECEQEPATTVAEFRVTFRPLADLYGALPAARFTPKKLKATRLRMVQGGWEFKGEPQAALCRSLANRRIARIIRVFKFGVEEELISVTVCHALEKASRSAAARSALDKVAADFAVHIVRQRQRKADWNEPWKLANTAEFEPARRVPVAKDDVHRDPRLWDHSSQTWRKDLPIDLVAPENLFCHGWPGGK